jgi:hypothetical protein
MRTSTATNSFRSEAEVAEGRRPPQDRAEENFALLLQVIAGDSSVFVPWVKIDSFSRMDPSYKGSDFANAPFVKGLRLTIDHIAKSDTAQIGGSYGALTTLRDMIVAAAEALDETEANKRGAFYPILTKAKVEALIVLVRNFASGVGHDVQYEYFLSSPRKKAVSPVPEMIRKPAKKRNKHWNG